MYMRSIASTFAIVALAATQGTGIPPLNVKYILNLNPRFQSRVVATMIKLSDVMRVTGTPPGKTQKPACRNLEIRIVIVGGLLDISLL